MKIDRVSFLRRFFCAVVRYGCSLVLAAAIMPGSRHVARAEVTGRGSYQRSIAVEVPAFHRIAPSIALLYDSNGGNGPLGLGWSLQAGSQITRTSKGLGAPHYDATDQLWLDGTEMLPCSAAQQSASCKSNGTHSTRIESYTRIRQNLSNGQNRTAAVTVNTWTVWKRDGTRFEYQPHGGDITSPDRTQRWLLADAVDTHGNKVHYEYTCDSRLTCYLKDITYGAGKACKGSTPETGVGAGAGLPLDGVDVHFYWESRPDPQSTAIGGALQVMLLRLRAIDVSDGNRRVRVYQINYQPETGVLSAYKRYQSWVSSIQTFGSDATLDPSGTVTSGTALPAHTFSAPAQLYAPAPSFANVLAANSNFLTASPANFNLPPVYSHRTVPAIPPSTVMVPANNEFGAVAVVTNTRSVALGDFDGDGRLDFLQWSVNSACDQLVLNTITASADPSSTGRSETHAMPGANLCAVASYSADLNGDGRTDVLFVRFRMDDPTDPNDHQYLAELIPAISNGDASFTLAPATVLCIAPDNNTLLQARCGVGDVNGDGRQDFVCSVKKNGVWVIVQAISSGGGQFLFPNRQDTQINTLTDQHTLAVGDANGDGLSDLMVVDRPGPGANTLTLKIGVSLGNGTFVWRNQNTSLSAPATGQFTRTLVGDFNGDGRADLAFVAVNSDSSGGMFTTFTSKGGTAHQYETFQQPLSGNTPEFSVGDLNGDGLDDILVAVHHQPHNASTCGVAIDHDHPSLYYVLSKGNGIFPMPDTSNPICYQEVDWQWLGTWNAGVQAINVNGDHRADAFQFQVKLVNQGGTQERFELVDSPSPVTADDLWRWRPADVNGDGRPDWVYTTYGNTGLIVVTVLSQPDGTWRAFRQTIPSTGGPAASRPADLARVDAVANWFLADVGGSADNHADGKADIVIVDEFTQQVVTLLSNGDGTWRRIPAPTSPTVAGNPSSPEAQFLAGHADVGNWRAVDVNGDGLADLVHTQYWGAPAGQQRVVVETLLAKGDGTWGDPVVEPHFVGLYGDANVRAFIPADIDGDGRMDLVKVGYEWDSAGHGSLVLWSLVARGSGSWDEPPPVRIPFPNEAVTKWRPMEINGDGRTDLALVDSTPNQPLMIQTMLSLGNGAWQSSSTGFPVGPAPMVDTESQHDFRIADLDGDGKQDFVQLSQVGSGQAATMVVWNHYPNFVQSTTPGLALRDSHTNAWQLVDTDGDGHPELVHVETSSDPSLDVISIPVLETRITTAANGMGAKEDIAYGTSVGSHADMPLGFLAHVAKSLGIRAIDSSGPYDSLTTYRYTGATYAHARRLRRFLGFQHIDAADTVRIRASDFELTDSCYGRKSREDLLDPQSQLLNRVAYQFAPTGASAAVGSFALCRTDTVHREEWERAAQPRVSEKRLQFDDFGNVKDQVETGDLADPRDDREIRSTINFNLTDFLVDRLASQELFGIGGNGHLERLSWTQYEYDNSGDYTQPPGPVGDLTRIRQWKDQTNSFANTTYAYDAAGNLHQSTNPAIPSNPNGVVITIGSDCEYARFPETYCDPAHCTSVVWDKRLGKVHSTTDANSNQTTFDFDPLGRPTSITRPDGSFEHWVWPAPNQWNSSAQAVRHEISDNSPGDGVLWDLTYFDGLGRTTRIEREGGVSAEAPKYDGASRRVVQITAPHFTADPPALNTISYDPAGRPLSHLNPDGSSHSIRYGVGTRTTTNENGATTGYDLDAFGQITAVHENRRTCFRENCKVLESPLTRYRYDGLGRLFEITDAQNHTTTIQWDSLGRIRAVSDPDRGLTQSQWNDDGTKASESNANGSTRTMTYDSLGRPSVLVSRDSANRQTRRLDWTWDNDSTGHTAGSSIGRIVHLANDSLGTRISSSYHYDLLGRVDEETECIDNKCYELGLKFDPAGRLRRVVYPDASGHVANNSLAVDYQYDNRGWLAAIPGYVSRFDHDAAGRTTDILFVNGIEEARHFSSQRGWSDSVQVFKPSAIGPHVLGAVLFRQTTSHDPAGRVSAQDIDSAGVGAYNDIFAHDDLGRLTAVTSSDPTRNRAFKYDAVGNLTFHSLLGDVFYRDPKHVHAATDTSGGAHFVYDSAGQMKTSSGLEFVWNDDDRPLEIIRRSPRTTSRFVYNSYGTRVKSEVNGSVELDPYPVVQAAANGAIVRSIVAEGRLLARVDPAGPHFLHADALGSVRVVTNASGAPVALGDFGPWGEQANFANQYANPIAFAGGRADSQTGLDYMDARYYDPQLAHFVSPDPTVPDAFHPQSLNRYAYALNDPVTLADPSGLQPDGDVLGRPQEDDTEPLRLQALDPITLSLDRTQLAEPFEPDYPPDYPPSSPAEWAPYSEPAGPLSPPPLLGASETQQQFQEDRRREAIFCGVCHAPDPSTVHRGTEQEVTMYSYSMLGIGSVPTAAAGAAAVSSAVAGDAILEGSVIVYQAAPRLWNFVQTAAAGALGIRATWPTPLSPMPSLQPGPAPKMLTQAVKILLSYPKASVSDKASTFVALAGQIERNSPDQWAAEAMNTSDGSFMITGTLGRSIVIDASGEIFAGDMNNPAQFVRTMVGNGFIFTPIYEALKHIQ
ncbi:MAG: VCBS repeat-containing protein [Acidobacteria bacterium]|nr:VCBS repeat-containing protein [Acidobacteriota bacterium]